LGHYHRGKLVQAGKAKLFYPGSPEPLGFGEDEPHSVGLITLAEQEVGVEQISISSNRFLVGEVDVTGADSREEIKNRLEDWAKANGNPSTFLKAILVGELNAEIELDLAILQERLQEYCACGLLVNHTHTGFDLTTLMTEKTVKGEFVRTMQARRQKANEQGQIQLERALVYGLMAFEQREILPGR